jgi:peptidoglycan/xylan/chitin deacetylase (PgdA/CDA1 family)
MALTFDDGPFIYTSHILDVLAQYNASATFFITGNNNGELSSTFHWPNNHSPSRKGPNRQHEFGLARTHPVSIRSLLNGLY